MLLKTVPVRLSGPGGKIKTYAILDEGSTVTLVDDEVAKALGARGPVRALRIRGAGGMCVNEGGARRVKLSVQGESQEEFPIEAYTVTSLQLPEARQGGYKPRILIGQDNARLIVSRELREAPGDSRILSRTALGWVWHGGRDNSHNEDFHATLLTDNKNNAHPDNRLDDLLKQHFAIESLGVGTKPRDGGVEIQQARQIMMKTTARLKSGAWETGLLWKPGAGRLPNNRDSAVTRLLSLERKLSRDADLREEYHSKIDDLLRKGYAREMTSTEAAALTGREWYLPHFAVTNVNKPGKIRVVFDAACQYRRISLNDHLLAGPDLLSSLFGNILRFREGRVAMAADIQEMFLRVKIRHEDQQAQRFLWRRSCHEEPTTFVLTSMMFGAKCSPSSAQYVRNRAAEVCAVEYPEAAAAIAAKFYMDDYLEAVPSASEAAKLTRDVTTVLQKSGFQLTNWACNHPDVLKGIPEERRAKTAVTIAGSSVERVLGVLWEPADDCFLFRRDAKAMVEAPAIPTKRELLSATMKIFDPLGFVTCLTVRSKILLQEIWRTKLGWDNPLADDHARRWQEWRTLMTQNSVKIPRCMVWNHEDRATLHVFSDASELACCVVAYRVETGYGGSRVAFVAAKTKVAPLRPLSIPRLELQAALMAARLADSIKKESTATYARTCYWTDSSTVLCWLRTDPRRYSVFVANRLGEIDELTEVRDWRWVPTRENPADIGTRDAEAPDLSASGRWFCGPDFITRSAEHWPQERHRKAEIPDDDLELRTRYVGLTYRQTEALPELGRFSSWLRLIRVTSWTLRFVRRCRQDSRAASGRTLNASELDTAERHWIRMAQEDSFGSDIATLRRGEKLTTSSRITTLDPIYDSEGVLRMGTRLSAVSDREINAPVILDGDHPYTRLWIRHVHEREHASTEKTIAQLREGFFVLRMRTNARMVAHRCLTCRMARAKPQTPLMGQLPEGRLAARVRPFTHCGLDYFGPMYVTIGRRREKRYGALFTCLTTRAVHLELAASMTADSAIQAIRRMTARRGQPAVFYSDNGTNFHGADQEMRDAIRSLQDDQQLSDEMANSRTKWKFIPPGAPHMGGAWERLVRSVKRALQAVLKERAPREETLLTALAEAEHTVNCRPLTHVSVDPRDDEPLTPNHFLIGTASGRPHLSHFGPDEETVCLRKQWRISQQLADMFWRRWLKEYRPTLAQRSKWTTRTKPIEKDDLVVIVDASQPRNSWPRGRVVEAYAAPDGQVRVARVKTSTGIYTRPTSKLAVLQLGETPDEFLADLPCANDKDIM